MLSFQVVPIDVFYYYIYEIIVNWYTYVMTPASIDGCTQCLYSQPDVQFYIYVLSYFCIVVYCIETIKTHWISFLWLHLL